MTIVTENGVPILDRGDGQRIGISHAGRAVLAEADDGLLLGESVGLHCPRLRATGEEGKVDFTIGASTLHEAATEVIGAFDFHHLDPPGESSDTHYPPEWVVSTHPELAQLLADYYSTQTGPAIPVNLRTNIGLDIVSAGVFAAPRAAPASRPAAGTRARRRPRRRRARSRPTASTWPANSVTGQMVVTTSGATASGSSSRTPRRPTRS
jgi:hypothetical protein